MRSSPRAGATIKLSAEGKLKHFRAVGWIVAAATLAYLWLAGRLRMAEPTTSSAEKISLAAAAEAVADVGEPLLGSAVDPDHRPSRSFAQRLGARVRGARHTVPCGWKALCSDAPICQCDLLQRFGQRAIRLVFPRASIALRVVAIRDATVLQTLSPSSRRARGKLA
jgi:hypothetical protein